MYIAYFSVFQPFLNHGTPPPEDEVCGLIDHIYYSSAVDWYTVHCGPALKGVPRRRHEKFKFKKYPMCFWPSLYIAYFTFRWLLCHALDLDTFNHCLNILYIYIYIRALRIFEILNRIESGLLIRLDYLL